MFKTDARLNELENNVSRLEGNATFIRHDHNRLRDDFRELLIKHNVLRDEVALIKAHFGIEVVYQPARTIVREVQDE